MPRGTNRRIHLAYDKSGFVDLGPIVDQVPVNEGVMPVHYGYIEGTKNETEGDEVDVIVFSKNSYKTGDRVEVEILGSLVRKDGDHKIIAHDSSESNLVFKNLSEAEQKIIVDFMGYKSPIISIDSKEQAEEYVQLNKTKWK